MRNPVSSDLVTTGVELDAPGTKDGNGAMDGEVDRVCGDFVRGSDKIVPLRDVSNGGS